MKCIFEVNTICRLCLRVDEKVYRINKIHHKAFIESIIKLKQFHYVPTDDEYVCYICNALLTKTFNFMQTIWNAQETICVLLKNTDMITEPMFEHIDRHKNGLNPITLSSNKFSVEICENVKYNSCSDKNANTKTEEVDLDLFIDKVEAHSKKRQKYKNKCNIKKNKNHSTNEKKLIVSLICSSDEDKEPEKIILDEVQVEIDDIKTEDGDPLTIDFNTGAHDDLKLEPIKDITKKIALHRKRSRPAKLRDSPSSSEKEQKCKKKKQIDDDYQPDSTSHSEDSDYDLYDDEGKRTKSSRGVRVYPRKCDHCDYEVQKGREHYRHYLFEHPNVEYPYRPERNYACSICGKLYTKVKLGSHEAGHAIQKLKCPLCPNVYSNKVKLYIHKQSVHSKRKYTCDYCSKTFKTRNDIMRHIRTHTGNKPFKCHICGDGFAHSGNRSIHIRSKHQNYKYVPKKRKRAQKVRRNNKHDSTDTEITSNNKKIIRRTKKKPIQKSKK